MVFLASPWEMRSKASEMRLIMVRDSTNGSLDVKPSPMVSLAPAERSSSAKMGLRRACTEETVSGATLPSTSALVGRNTTCLAHSSKISYALIPLASRISVRTASSVERSLLASPSKSSRTDSITSGMHLSNSGRFEFAMGCEVGVAQVSAALPSSMLTGTADASRGW